jgi:hypothetical protein
MAAMSLNGMIADKEGGEEFLSHDGWVVFSELASRFGNFIVGRRTVEIVNEKYSGFGFHDIGALRIFLSRSEEIKHSGFVTATSPQRALGFVADTP